MQFMHGQRLADMWPAVEGMIAQRRRDQSHQHSVKDIGRALAHLASTRVEQKRSESTIQVVDLCTQVRCSIAAYHWSGAKLAVTSRALHMRASAWLSQVRNSDPQVAETDSAAS